MWRNIDLRRNIDADEREHRGWWEETLGLMRRDETLQLMWQNIEVRRNIEAYEKKKNPLRIMRGNTEVDERKHWGSFNFIFATLFRYEMTSDTNSQSDFYLQVFWWIVFRFDFTVAADWMVRCHESIKQSIIFSTSSLSLPSHSALWQPNGFRRARIRSSDMVVTYQLSAFD